MNKWLTLAAATLMSFSAVAAEKVVLYNWADYIPDTVLKQFTKETGIEVEVATFDSNESMFAKLQLLNGKGYDLTIPTTFFIERMKRADLIQPIDKAKLTNLQRDAAYQTNKSKLLSQIGQDLGGIGQEELFKKYPELAGLGYDSKGRKIKK